MTVGWRREFVLFHEFLECLPDQVDIANGRFNLLHALGIVGTREFDAVHGQGDLIHANQLLLARGGNLRDGLRRIQDILRAGGNDPVESF